MERHQKDWYRMAGAVGLCVLGAQNPHAGPGFFSCGMGTSVAQLPVQLDNMKRSRLNRNRIVVAPSLTRVVPFSKRATTCVGRSNSLDFCCMAYGFCYNVRSRHAADAPKP